MMMSFGLINPMAVSANNTPPAGSGIPTAFGVGDANTTAGVNVAGDSGTDQGDSIINVVKNIINYALGFLGLIVLVMLLRGGFNMVTAGADDEKYKEGFKVLKNAAIGI